jgi:hypothetical protein
MQRRARTAVKWSLLAAGLGGLCACPDGLLLGAIFGGSLEGVAVWAGAAAGAGAVCGGLIGLLAALLGGRMVLRPPEKGERREARDE